jgi:hypothetical protein
MKLSDHQWEFLKDVATLIMFAERKGYKVTGGELWRTQDQQNIYLDSNKSKASESQHQKRLAIDLNVFIANVYRTDTESYKELGDFWESLNPANRWGGNFTRIKDGNHFERVIL